MGLSNGDTKELVYLRSDSPEEDVLKSLVVKEKKGSIKWKKILPGLSIFLSLVTLMVALILIGMAFKRKEPEERYSEEARRVQFIQFLNDVENYIEEEHKIFDPRPTKLKERTDRSRRYLQELNEKGINEDKLKPRELRALSQVKLTLKTTFQRPYDANYYAADWMMGPNSFCWQDLCTLYYGVASILVDNIPFKENMNEIKKMLERHGQGVNHYIDNMKYGVKAGMVRSIEQCEAGLVTIKTNYIQISLKNETGILHEQTIKNLFEIHKDHLQPDIIEKLNKYLVDYIGKPIISLIRFMENDYLKYCVPSSVSSGLGNLPLDYVYVNGIADSSQPTTKKLPTGETISGKETYASILYYFTTSDKTPEEYYSYGKELLKTTYAKMIEYAKNHTGLSVEDLAVQELKKELEDPSMYFATNLPEEESNNEAHRKCTSDETAQIHCPKRWEAMTKWLKYARELTNFLESQVTHLFYFTSSYQTTPSCPVSITFNFNPADGAQMYVPATRECSDTPKYVIPFWMDKPGPIYYEWLINAHETFPGHHLQVQGYQENFLDDEDDAITRMDRMTYVIPFVEGWANYAFDPVLFSDTSLFNTTEGKRQRYSIYNEKVWSAARFMIDAGVHYYGYSREWALEQIQKYAWMTGDFGYKEVTRYQSNPGQGLAYTIGQDHILYMRRYTEEKLGDKFDIRDFHYQVLRQGSVTLDYHTKNIEKYVKCVLDKSKEGCEHILTGNVKKFVPSQKSPDNHILRRYRQNFRRP